METTRYLHKVDSSVSSRVLIVRQGSFKTISTTSINTEENSQQLATLVTSVSTPKKRRKSLFNMRRRQAKDPSAVGDQRICTKDNCLSCCKKFTAFMFSRVGLFVVMIGYVALGGWLFQALEAENEQDMRLSMSNELNTTLYKLWNETLRVNSYPYHDKKGNFTLYATLELEKFEETVIRQVQQGFDGRTKPDADPDWNYFGAVLYAVTLVSTIGYGHITTKTVQGKIATILYSAFGVPLMMLFVANIGSTMAKMFAFVFSRITMVFCCRWKNKRRRRKLKTRTTNDQTTILLDEKIPIETLTSQSNLKQTSIDQDNDHSSKTSSPIETNSNNIANPSTDTKPLPADVRLNLLTGVPTNTAKSRSPSSTSSTSERSKDALVRINELLRQNSVQDLEKKITDDSSNEFNQRSRSDNMSPIQFYINETNKLTSNLENSIHEQTIIKQEQEKINVTNLDDMNIQQVNAPETPSTITDDTVIKTENEKKKKLKRSKSESTHNRKTQIKPNANLEPSPINDGIGSSKSSRRRFFLRKLKKQSTVGDEIDKTDPLEQESMEIFNKSTRRLPRKSQSFDESLRPLSPPPYYEESATHEITSLPTVTWKADHELSSTKTTFDFPINPDLEDDDDLYEDEQRTVPLLVTVFVIPLYLTLGAILFNIWEKWGFLNSFYFCFITLTTIGFGDFVPGSSLTVSAAKEKLISAALYILLGLVLIAMCFNLMKEQLSQKVKQVAGKWGIMEF